ncbi:MAG: bifunctional glutamate N-acetyltransferase/amino-acid acetyltransferase ArgJ [Ignavibacteriae bacterium]|nr:MAG: bifunctional glutamate N-acetyltransferase/amino-acid acetyltransferase ArgJ [Ignavibacteriota bacterium]
MELDASQECAGGVTAAEGFTAGGVYCGIRKTKKDIAIVRSSKPAVVAGVFTLNKVVAAPLLVDKIQLKKSNVCSAVVINSGNANACTGEHGLNDAWTMVQTAADALHLPREQVMVSSTGVIGQYLPMENIVNGINDLSTKLCKEGNKDAAEAIMTTDVFSKECAMRFSLDSSVITVGGMAKGSGMIAPNMATMLAFVTTDAAITPAALQSALRTANGHSFNRITVDGDMSTNDMLLVLANGLAQNDEIQEHTPAFDQFVNALEYVLIKLAKMIARDGEGATKFVEILVNGARTEDEAAQAARSVANSNLVKTALHGADANWGRILCAVGYSGIDFDPANVSIGFNDLPVLKPNYEIVLDEEKAKAVLSRENIIVQIDLHQGSAEARFWTCDLTKEYIHINASYRS